MQNVIAAVEQSWQSGDWSAVSGRILGLVALLAVFYVLSLAAGVVYTQLMAVITQGSLEKMREKMFNGMQDLPIRYFDTHNHGDIMSYYTNDIDTLRQLLSQSIPMALSSLITIITVSISMLILNIPLACVTFAVGALMIIVSKNVSKKSSKYFIRQQKDLGTVNGFIEEMMEGSKVIKVFNHEQASIEEFNQYNEDLFHAADKANKYANVLMPILGNMGYISLVLNALVGSILAINHVGGLTLGTIAAFIQLNRSFNGPIGQISTQLNAIIMAQAGAQRITRRY